MHDVRKSTRRLRCTTLKLPRNTYNRYLGVAKSVQRVTLSAVRMGMAAHTWLRRALRHVGVKGGRGGGGSSGGGRGGGQGKGSVVNTQI